MFENYSKCRIWIFQFWHFSPIFVLSGNTVWPFLAMLNETFSVIFKHRVKADILLPKLSLNLVKSSAKLNLWLRSFDSIKRWSFVTIVWVMQHLQFLVTSVQLWLFAVWSAKFKLGQDTNLIVLCHWWTSRMWRISGNFYL